MKRHTSMPRRRAVPALVAASLAVPLALVPTSFAASAAGEQTDIDWFACPGLEETGLECGTVTVPVDYTDPQSPTIDVAVSRLQTAVPSLRRGVLVMNPGGPGDSGLLMPLEIGTALDEDVLARYDLIGFDPRGTGFSAPINCDFTDDRLYERTHPFLLEGGVDANVALAQDTGATCAANVGPILPYITTANTVRDLERIRIALQEPKISYLGYSYGTYLGAAYASQYPTKSDRFVLDSVMSPEGIGREQLRAWAPAIEQRFPDLTTFVAANNATYGLGSTSSQVRGTYLLLAAVLDDNPLQLPPGSLPEGWGDQLTGNAFRAITGQGLYADAFFPTIAELWQGVKDGILASVLESLDILIEQELTLGTASDTQWSVWLAVMCGDQEFPSNVNKYKLDVLLDGLQYPIAGTMAANVWACAMWPNAPLEPKVTINNQGPRNILLINSRRDPVTPVVHAQAMRNKLGNRAALVVAEQGGHGVFLNTPNTCVSDYATAFLVSGTLPSSDKTCAGYPGALGH